MWHSLSSFCLGTGCRDLEWNCRATLIVSSKKLYCFFCLVHYFINGFLNCGFFGLADFLSFFKGIHLFCQAFWHCTLSSGSVLISFLEQANAKFLFSAEVLYFSLYCPLWKKPWEKTCNWLTVGCCCWCSGSPEDRRDFKRVEWVTLFFWSFTGSCRLSHM